MNNYDKAMLKIEPEAKNFGPTQYELSIAISLKRIADALEKLTKPTMPQMTEEERKRFIKEYNNANNVTYERFPDNGQ